MMTKQEKIEKFKELVVDSISRLDQDYVRPTLGAYCRGRSYCQLFKRTRYFGITINVERRQQNLHLWNDQNRGIRLWLETENKIGQVVFGSGAQSLIVKNRHDDSGHVWDVVRQFDIESATDDGLMNAAQLVANDYLKMVCWLAEQGMIDLVNSVRSVSAIRLENEINELIRNAGLAGTDVVVERKTRGGCKGVSQLMSNASEANVTAEEIPSTKVHLRPIPVGVSYPEGIIDSRQISGVVSWVTSIGALFNRDAITLSDGRVMRPGQYIIPPYQRKYTWSYDNVSQLCRDLLKSKDAGRETYHLGTVILHHQEGDGEDSFYVVDGQQRLTTISYLMNCEIFASGASSPKIKNSDIKNILSALEEYREEKDHILEQLKRSTLVVIAVGDINEAFQLFSTQNGRGRPLTPANLLKAYHLHELEKGEDASEKDRVWESNNAEKTVRDGRLLSQVLGEHLYRLRCWGRGEFPKEQFLNADIKEFKGITFNEGNKVGVPAQNLMRLRQCALADGRSSDYYSRVPNDKMYALATIDQPIINGADFFKYVESYTEAYRVLFGPSTVEELVGFKKFYEGNCNYRRSDRRGDTYARHVFESLCLFCYDRFGAIGLDACKSHLYRCAYYERAVKLRCYYVTCGSTFAVSAVRVMSVCMTLADVKDRLHSLSGTVLESYRNEKQVFSSKPTPVGVDCVRRVYEN